MSERIEVTITPFADERGVAVPMAVVALVILSALGIGLSALAVTEPVIANNHLMVAQARALAEAGVEQAFWALNTPSHPRGIPSAGPIPAPYDGSQLVPVPSDGAAVGGFRVKVTTGASIAERIITAVGWVPDDTRSGAKAHQRVTVTAINPQLLFKNPPAALLVRGDLELGDSSVVDARADATCGNKVGTATTGATWLGSPAPSVWGAADHNDIKNEMTDAHRGPLPANAHDIVTNLAPSSFDQWSLTDADINVLRIYAKSSGTYLKGPVSFNSGNRMPNGLIFVDTVSGKNIAKEGVKPATPSADLASVSVDSGATADPSGTYRGWLFVNGTLFVNGSVGMSGLIYAQNDLGYHGSGQLRGAAISRNIQDPSSTSIDTDLLGTARITYSCAEAQTGGGTIPWRWMITNGSYRELCDSCG